MSDTLTMILIASLLLSGLGIVAFLWALKTGQFDDEDKTAHTVFFDGEDELNAAREREEKRKAMEKKEG
jgi:cbb3-type cytochrome oxidase maturation protein